MKSIAKVLLVGAVTMAAVALTSMPSQAAKKKAAAPCTPGMVCTAPCKAGSSCNVMACAGDGKWYTALFTPVCLEPACPSKC
jgi:hypothetical protein